MRLFSCYLYPRWVFWRQALWVFALALYVLAGTSNVPFHGDEATQIFMSRDYGYLFIKDNPKLILYDTKTRQPYEQILRLINGTLNKYLIGLAWDMSGYTLDDVNKPWIWVFDFDYNQRTGHMPEPALLTTSRLPSSIFLASSVVLIFMLGKKIGGSTTAYFASLYYVLNPAILLNGRRAIMESTQLFFSLLVVLLGIWLLQNRSWRAAVLLGLASGLALASKHSTAFTLIAVFGAYGVYMLQDIVRGAAVQRRKQIARLLNRFALAALTTAGAFLLLNPAWWGDPIERAITVFQLRRLLLTIQWFLSPLKYHNFKDSLAGFVDQILFTRPQYYETAGWGAHIGKQISRYEASPWDGVSIGGSPFAVMLFTGILLIGLRALLQNRQTHGMQRWVFGLWFFIMLMFALFLIPLEWQRYYLPLYPIVGLLFGLGMARIVEWLRWSELMTTISMISYMMLYGRAYRHSIFRR